MTGQKLTLALPSKGRLMEQSLDLFARAGLNVSKVGAARGYRGTIAEYPDVEVAFVSASEIAAGLKAGDLHLGVTGEDLVRELIPDADRQVAFAAKLGFGHADVVVAVPDCWIDVHTVADLEDISLAFRQRHKRWLRVATKYMNTTRRFFADHGFSDYRIVESLGATEGTPAAGTADLIVDITSTGETLRANGLRILDDGVILRSQANLVRAQTGAWTPELQARADDIIAAIACTVSR